LVQTVTITVTVIDEAGDPVENAQVALYVGETQVMNEDTSAMGVAAED
jgi:protocatechuate 3,4-dioxygenase beta subunit